MKIFAYHDSTGTIYSLVSVHGPERISVMLTPPKPGLFISEVEGLELKAGAGEADALRQIGKSHRVSTGSHPRCTLVKRP